MARGNSKTENKTVVEKAVKALSPKRQAEADHLAGKHKIDNGVQPDCGFCIRRVKRLEKKTEAVKRFFSSRLRSSNG